MPVYEGPEKRLEIILSSPVSGLRSDTDGRWKKVVRLSRAQIISKISNDFMDACLLSESSLFVREDRILLITCGKTAPANALPLLLDLAGKDRVAFLFYEQRNFVPSGSPGEFEKDAAEISKCFPGKCFKLGNADHDYVNCFHCSPAPEKRQMQPVLQLLMHGIDPGVMQIFCRRGNGSAARTRSLSGLETLCDPDMKTDDHLFSPCGYSLNSIRGKDYLAVHVTPQPVNSYVSFETSIMENRQQIIGKALKIFRPARFSLLLRSGMDDRNSPSFKKVKSVIQGYAVTDRNLYESGCGYAVTFFNCIRQE